MFAGCHGPQDQRASRLESPHELDDDVDLGIIENGAGVGGEGKARQIESFARAGQVEISDAPEHKPTAGALLQGRLLGEEQLDHARADRAKTEKPKTDLTHGLASA